MNRDEDDLGFVAQAALLQTRHTTLPRGQLARTSEVSFIGAASAKSVVIKDVQAYAAFLDELRRDFDLFGQLFSEDIEAMKEGILDPAFVQSVMESRDISDIIILYLHVLRNAPAKSGISMHAAANIESFLEAEEVQNPEMTKMMLKAALEIDYESANFRNASVEKDIEKVGLFGFSDDAAPHFTKN